MRQHIKSTVIVKIVWTRARTQYKSENKLKYEVIFTKKIKTQQQ